jgi:hypothetical protein
VLAAVALSGCGGSSSASEATTTAADSATSVLESTSQQVTFAEAKAAIDDLYRAHPDLESFTVQDVQYNEITRGKVLDVCRRGGAEQDPASLESVRVAGCAPLIFYFWQYGQQKPAPDAVEAARKLYWYAATSIHGPFSAGDSLDGLLRSWGVG